MTMVFGLTAWPTYFIKSERAGTLRFFMESIGLRTFADVEAIVASLEQLSPMILKPPDIPEAGNIILNTTMVWLLKVALQMAGLASKEEEQKIISDFPEARAYWTLLTCLSKLDATPEDLRGKYSWANTYGPVCMVYPAAMFEKLDMPERSLQYLNFHEQIRKEHGACRDPHTNLFGLRVRAKCLAKLERLEVAATIYEKIRADAFTRGMPMVEALTLRDYLTHASSQLKPGQKIEALTRLADLISNVKAPPERLRQIFGDYYQPGRENDAGDIIAKQQTLWRAHP